MVPSGGGASSSSITASVAGWLTRGVGKDRAEGSRAHRDLAGFGGARANGRGDNNVTETGLAGRAGIVTGAASGIGAAVTRALTREGARVVAADIHQERLDAFAAGFAGSAGEVEPMSADVRDFARHAAHMEAVMGPGHVAIGSDLDGLIRPARGLASHASMWALAMQMRAEGIGEPSIAGIMGGNALRLLVRATRRASRRR